MKLHPKAIISGVAVDVVLSITIVPLVVWFLATILNTDVYPWALIFGHVATVIGGYVTSRKSSSFKLVNAAVCGAMMMLISIPIAGFVPAPIWFHIAGIVPVIPVSMFGAYFDKRRVMTDLNQVQSTPSTPSSVEVVTNNDSQKSGLALTSLVLGIVSFIPLVGVLLGLLAIVLGLMGRHEIKMRNLQGKKMANAGVILGICGILFSIFLYGSLFYWGFIAKSGPYISLKEKASQDILTQDAGQLELYKQKFGKYPQTLKEASDAGYVLLVGDHYLRPFHYTASDDGQSYELISLGSDGELGTGDDIFPRN